MKFKLSWFIFFGLGLLAGILFGMLIQQSIFISGVERFAYNLEGVEINIDLNETIMVDRAYENIERSWFRENWEDNRTNITLEKKEYVVERYIVRPYSVAHVWSDGVIDCQEYINKSHSWKTMEGMLMDEVLNPTNNSITCKYLVEIE